MLYASLKKLLTLLDPQEKKRLIAVFALNVITVLTDMLGILSIFPFLQLVINPKLIHENKQLLKLYNLGGFHGDKSFLIFTGLSLLIVFTCASILKGTSLWLSNQFAYDCNKNASVKLLTIYLNETYLESIRKNSAQVASHLLTNVDIGVSSVLNSWLGLFSSAIIVFLLLATLIVTQPISALVIFISIGIFYYFLDKAIKNQIQQLGIEVVKTSRLIHKQVNEATGGIKELKYLGRTNKVTTEYEAAYRKFVNLKAKNNVFQFMPKLIIDTLAFGISIIIILFVLDTDADISKSIPWMGLFAFIVLRLVPNSQVILQHISTLRYSNNALDMVYEDLLRYASLSRTKEIDITSFSFKNFLCFENVNFSYNSNDENVLTNISLKINKGEMVAFVGKTGSGKSTLIDLILGLINPTSGKIFIDGKLFDETNISQWQQDIGYVPQFVFLADSSISTNVAFGISEELISQDKVIEACKKANIHDFIIEKLPLGYNTIVGERGIQLSGGQRQRLGIARALYNDPDIIILDEATSALDNKTENNVMEEIQKIAGLKTIILIAHRLSTVEKCDNIFLLDNGAIVSSGIYSEMVIKEPEFFNKAAST